MEAIQLHELLKILGIGLTPATVSLVGYFLYRSLIGRQLEYEKKFERLQAELEKAYVRRDVNEEHAKRLEEANEDLQRQVDSHTRWLEDLSRYK